MRFPVNKLATGWADSKAFQQRPKTRPDAKKQVCLFCGRAHEADEEYDMCRARWIARVSVERAVELEEQFLP